MPILEEWKISLDADQVLRAQGADPAIIRTRRPALAATAEWALKEGLPLLKPRVLYRMFPVVGLRHERLELIDREKGDGKLVLSGRLIAQHMGPAEEVVALVCTIGGALEAVSSEVMAEDPVLGLALDSLGSAAVEALSLNVCNHFEALARRDGKQTSIPLSPGMIGWPVDTGQKQIFNLLEAQQIGVSITSSSQMQPRKSLSMVLAVGRNIQLGGRTCDYCSLSETCRYQNHYH